MDHKKKIIALRNIIDRIDGEVINLLRERLKVAREIGQLKKENNLPVVDPQRESNLGERLNTLTDDDLLKKKFINRIWQLILEESYRVQKEEQD